MVEKWGKNGFGATLVKFVNPTYFGSVDSTNPSLSDITNLTHMQMLRRRVKAVLYGRTKTYLFGLSKGVW